MFSRDELKQSEMASEFIKYKKKLRFFIGDIRDLQRIKLALNDVNIVVHAAALKQVPTAEYNPFEVVKTNIIGTQNIIDAIVESKVERAIALSTDKAAAPINLYGASKLTADKLFIAANNYSIAYGTSFSVVRDGNVMGSRGSVIPYFRQIAESGEPLPLTDLRMTRFWISIQQAVEFVVESFEIMQGGELYVPRIPSMKLKDLAMAISPNSKLIEIGMRPGEKLHEEMITETDSLSTV